MYRELAKSGLLKKVMSVRNGDKVSKIRIKLGYIDDLKKILNVDDPVKYYQDEINNEK